MHCSANVNKNGNVGLFFGLSGLVKLPFADPKCSLMVMMNMVWGPGSVFNFEGVVMQKQLIFLREKEPVIFNA
ncbi:MAG: hypothetical protein Ct9H90mP22_2270 [Gammaproteobacteria bacterium]|nr:MAG: hypothetical protein Ct9H90mP22_2270 [Gammaproteobacteria bacterium]